MDDAFGRLMEAARVKCDITRTELANVIGRSESSVFRYEKGEQIPTRKMYEKLRDYLGLPNLSYEEMFFGEKAAGLAVLLDEFWTAMELGQESVASDLLIRLTQKVENEKPSKDLWEEILLARYVFFYANYRFSKDMTAKVYDLLYEVNGKQPIDVKYFQTMAQINSPQSKQEITGYNLWALLLLRDGEYVLPEIVFSTLLLLEKQRGRRNYHRETVLAGNLALSFFYQQRYREALETLERNETLLFYTGGVESYLFYETLKLSCYIYLEDGRNFERHWVIAEDLYRKVPKTLKNELALETLVYGQKKGLLIFRK